MKHIKPKHSLIMAMILSLTACGGGGSDPSSTTSSSPSSTQPTASTASTPDQSQSQGMGGQPGATTIPPISINNTNNNQNTQQQTNQNGSQSTSNSDSNQQQQQTDQGGSQSSSNTPGQSQTQTPSGSDQQPSQCSSCGSEQGSSTPSQGSTPSQQQQQQGSTPSQQQQQQASGTPSQQQQQQTGGTGSQQQQQQASGDQQQQQQQTIPADEQQHVTPTDQSAPTTVATTTPKPQDQKSVQQQQGSAVAPVTLESPGQQVEQFLQEITQPVPPAARHTQDMPDQYNDYQVHVVYAVPKGETDRGKDVTNYFTNSIDSWNHWLYVETAGREVKFDVYNGKLDITYVQLPHTDKEYSQLGTEKITQISADVSAALGGLKPNKKYMVYLEGGRQYDSSYVSCGDTKLNSQVVVQYLLGDPKGAVCFQGRDFASSPTVEPRYLDYIMLHELVHSEGGVSNTAPDASKNHVTDDPRDLMALTGNFDGWKILDVNKSNYYNINGLPAGIYNFATSKYLTNPAN